MIYPHPGGGTGTGTQDLRSWSLFAQPPGDRASWWASLVTARTGGSQSQTIFLTPELLPLLMTFHGFPGPSTISPLFIFFAQSHQLAGFHFAQTGPCTPGDPVHDPYHSQPTALPSHRPPAGLPSRRNVHFQPPAPTHTTHIHTHTHPESHVCVHTQEAHTRAYTDTQLHTHTSHTHTVMSFKCVFVLLVRGG